MDYSCITSNCKLEDRRTLEAILGAKIGRRLGTKRRTAMSFVIVRGVKARESVTHSPDTLDISHIFRVFPSSFPILSPAAGQNDLRISIR